MPTRYLTIFLITAACLATQAAAQQAPDDASNAPAASARKGAWVGVSVNPAPMSLRRQLKLPDGVGLVIEFVQPGSPADKAGLKPFDLLLKLGDQWLINQDQFAVLVRMHQPDDVVKFSFIRAGVPQTASVKLIEHELPRPMQWDAPFPWTEPQDGRHAAAVSGPAPASVSGRKVVTWLDGRREVSLITVNDHTTLEIKDAQSGRLIFSGPIDTDKQCDHLPPEAKRLLDSLSKITSEFEGKEDGDGTIPLPTTRPAGSRAH